MLILPIIFDKISTVLVGGHRASWDVRNEVHVGLEISVILKFLG